MTSSFGRYPELVTVGEGGDVDWAVNWQLRKVKVKQWPQVLVGLHVICVVDEHRRHNSVSKKANPTNNENQNVVMDSLKQNSAPF